MKESRWDIPARRPNFKRDLEFGHIGEEVVKTFLKDLLKGSIEVKSDRYRNGKMVVETEQNPRQHGWIPSGVMVTEAKWWVYIFTMNHGLVIVSTERLKHFISTLPTKRLTNFAKNSSNPSRGYLLPPEEVMLLLASEEYD